MLSCKQRKQGPSTAFRFLYPATFEVRSILIFQNPINSLLLALGSPWLPVWQL